MKRILRDYLLRQVASARDNPLALSLSVGTLALSILGARLQMPSLTMAMVILICVILGLTAFGKIRRSAFPMVIYPVGLALLFQVTLLSNGLVGTDIHSEYYFARLTEQNGYWNYTLPHSYNSALASVLFVPLMGKALGIGSLWVFKVVCPMLFALVPVVLYRIFKSQFGVKVACFGTIFFMIMPAYFLELPALPRQQASELMFVVALFLIIVSKLRLGVKLPLVAVFASLAIVFHYSLFPIVAAYFGVGCLTLLFFKNRTFPVKHLATITVVLIALGVFYFGNVAGGIPLKSMSWLGQSQLSQIIPSVGAPSSEPLIPSTLPPAISPETPVPTTPSTHRPTFEEHESLMQTALGMDMGQSSNAGKAFRVLQGITQALLAVGFVQLIRKRKALKPEYLGFCAGSVAILSLCLVAPGFSAMLNATRFYHIALLLLAPAMILGGLIIFRSHKILTLAVLIPYFLLTSGFIFEATKSTQTERLDVPFSVALSHQRLDLTSVYSDNDIAVKDWAYERRLLPIYADLNGELLLEDNYGLEGWGKGLKYLPFLDDPTTGKRETIPPDSYIFLRERNNETQTVTFWNGPGLRITYSYAEFGLTEELKDRPIIYQRGNATIYGRKTK